MSTHPIPELDAKGLRSFALTTAAIAAVLFGLFFPWLFSISFPTWPWVVAAVLAVWGLAHPTSLAPIYKGWMKFGLILNRITTPLILGLMFFGIFTPVAFIMRLIRRDTMERTLDADRASYRKPTDTRDKHSMENPF